MKRQEQLGAVDEESVIVTQGTVCSILAHYASFLTRLVMLAFSLKHTYTDSFSKLTV